MGRLTALEANQPLDTRLQARLKNGQVVKLPCNGGGLMGWCMNVVLDRDYEAMQLIDQIEYVSESAPIIRLAMGIYADYKQMLEADTLDAFCEAAERGDGFNIKNEGI